VGAVVRWHSDDAGWLRLMNSQGVQSYVTVVGHEMIVVAKGVFSSRAQGDSEPPVFYYDSFGIRHVRFLGKRGIEVFNSDRTAEWVEFGAHAGGETRILKYRVFGLAMDIMAARHGR